jgi:hypothetical protein
MVHAVIDIVEQTRKFQQMDTTDAGAQASRVRAALTNIRTDAAAAEVVGALANRGVQSVLLKGPALNDWYPPDSDRTYADADIWISPESRPQATATLTELGFEPMSEAARGELPEWWANHATAWRRERDQVELDLHQRLQGVQTDAPACWSLLLPRTEEIEVAGMRMRRLAEAPRALYVALHAAEHRADGGTHGRSHLDAALAHVSRDAWREAADLARQLSAIDFFSAGLRLVPEGAAMADAIGLPQPEGVQAALQANAHPGAALGFEQLASARGGERLRLLRRKLLPPPDFIRHWWAPAARGPLMLIVGYLYRPIWIALRAPAGWRAWRAARAQVRDRPR